MDIYSYIIFLYFQEKVSLFGQRSVGVKSPKQEQAAGFVENDAFRDIGDDDLWPRTTGWSYPLCFQMIVLQCMKESLVQSFNSKLKPEEKFV